MRVALHRTARANSGRAIEMRTPNSDNKSPGKCRAVCLACLTAKHLKRSAKRPKNTRGARRPFMFHYQDFGVLPWLNPAVSEVVPVVKTIFRPQ